MQSFQKYRLTMLSKLYHHVVVLPANGVDLIRDGISPIKIKISLNRIIISSSCPAERAPTLTIFSLKQAP